MPIYEYQCQQCEHRSEVLQRMSDEPLTQCERCGGELKKLLSAPAFQFKGSGWYVTDYARKDGGQGDSKGGGSSSGRDSSSDGGSGSGTSDGGSSSGDSSDKGSGATSSASTAGGSSDKGKGGGKSSAGKGASSSGSE